MPKRISVAESPTGLSVPINVTIVTLDRHLSGAVERAERRLRRDLPGLRLSLHAAAEWSEDQDAVERCRADIQSADIVLATMLFMDDHIQAVLPDLRARRDHCDGFIGCMAAGEVIRLTRLGEFTMDGEAKGAMAMLKRLRGAGGKGKPSSGAKQLAMLKRLPKILRFIPGKAQDVRAYFLTLQYWLAGSDDNVVSMVRLLINRYAAGERAGLRGALKVAAPVEHPEIGVYHPRLKGRLSASAGDLPAAAAPRGTVGLLLMRSYVLAGDTGHYDAVIDAFERRGLRVVPAFAAGLDSRPAIEAFFTQNGVPSVDAVVSLTGFSLVGGPAYNDAKAAEETLAALDVPYLAAQAVEFQHLGQWQGSARGLLPVEATMMVAIPELDGATGPMVYGGRPADAARNRDMQGHDERAAMLAARTIKLIELRRSARAGRKLAVVLFNFPPNSGAIGTAAFLSVFASLFNTLKSLKDAGYTVELPASVEALRAAIVEGNALEFGADANVVARIKTDDHVRREPYLAEIEAQWGTAPGRQQSDGASLHVLGARFGNVLVGLQPGFGYEGDPMRLLFERGFAPTHAFSAFYRYLREDFAAHAVLHFGTHGALEFMPGKQVGLSADCWPDRLIGDLPNLYLYAANNPSEGTIAKRRSAATTISYLTPPLAQAGLYRGLLDLKAALDRFRALAPEADAERAQLLPLVQSLAAEVDLAASEPAWDLAEAAARVQALHTALIELEHTLIPDGLHVVGKASGPAERATWLQALNEGAEIRIDDATLTALGEGAAVEALCDKNTPPATLAATQRLARTRDLLGQDHELPALLHALDGGYVRPAPGGDVLRNPDVLPTGRNLHGFDPFRLPSTFALKDGAQQAERLLARHMAEGNRLPETVALVLWGSDNLKSEGGPIGQALALLGAKPRMDSYGRLCGAELIPLTALGRPRLDVVMTLSGIFRDLLPMQTKLLAEACYLAASADEPLESNFVRRNALRYAEAHGVDLATASLRVFSNADGAYGSNVNQMVDAGCWQDEDELAEVYARRKCFAYGVNGKPVRQADLLKHVLGEVQLAYQNLESTELGVTTVDHYFDTLGGIGRAVKRAKGSGIPVYIGDQTRGEGKVRTLEEQVSLETRTRALNPKWYEGMLAHGYEGVRQIEAHVTNTVGWSATTGQVAPWVYQQLSETFVLDPAMRERLASLNPKASARVANRLLEAQARRYWSPDATTLDALQRAGEELEDRVEGLTEGVAA